MKFSELVFKPHAIPKHFHADVIFSNGYGASVISGEMFYTDPDHPYELGVLYNGTLTYGTEITSDVIGHLTEDDVTELLGKIEALK